MKRNEYDNASKLEPLFKKLVTLKVELNKFSRKQTELAKKADVNALKKQIQILQDDLDNLSNTKRAQDLVENRPKLDIPEPKVD